LVVFHFTSIQTLPKYGCRPPPHTVAPLHRPVAPLRGTKSRLACSFPLPKRVLPLPLFSQKPKHRITSLTVNCFSSTVPSPLPPSKHRITSLTVDCFSSTVPSPLPPPLYKRCREPHNLLPHPFLAFHWISLAQELALARAQVTVATTPSRLTASVISPPQAMTGEVYGESNVSHNLPSLHPVHAISRMKINPNSMKNPRTLHQHPYLFEKLCSNP
jgi:hypothetical protein